MRERIAAFLRTDMGRAATRFYRRLPRGVIFAGIWFALGAAAYTGAGSYRKLFTDCAQLFLMDLRMGWTLLMLQTGVLCAGIALGGAVFGLLGSWSAMGFKLLIHPKLSLRRRMSRTVRLAAATTAASLACIITLPFIDSLVNDAQKTDETALRAAFQIHNLKDATFLRLANEEREGHWWSDADDGAVVKDIKSAYVETGTSGRAVIDKFTALRSAHPHSPVHPIE